MYTVHSTGGLIPSQSQLSREAAERYAILVALRESRRNRRGSSAPRLTWTATLPHFRHHSERSGRTGEPIRVAN